MSVKKLLAGGLALTLLLTTAGLCVPFHEGQGGGGAEGCFTACDGRVPYSGGFPYVYLSGQTPASVRLPVCPSGFQRYHFGVPYPALVADIGPRVWFANLDIVGLLVNIVCAGGAACFLIGIPVILLWIRKELRSTPKEAESTGQTHPLRPFRPTLFSKQEDRQENRKIR